MITIVNNERLTRELHLIGQILSANWGPGARRTWTPSQFEQIDWPAFAALVWQHKIRPMAVAALQEAGWPGVPAAVRESLQQDAQTCVFGSMRQLRAQSELTAAASSAGIRFVALKGLALSTHLYGDPLVRESYDFDLLVDPGEAQRMKELIRGMGFQPLLPKSPLTARQSEILDQFVHGEKMINAASGVIVDVHHALTGNPWRMATRFEDLWRNRQTIRIGQNEVAIPGPMDLIQYLCAHAATHAWERWKWVGDLLVLYRQAGTDVLLAQQHTAQAEGWGVLFDSSVLVTSEVTGWEMPAALRTLCEGNSAAVRLARRSIRFSSRPATRAYFRGRAYVLRVVLFRLQLRRHPRYIAHELSALFHRPLDWYRLQLADSLIPVYYLLRPILTACRGFSQWIRSRPV